MSYRPRFTTSTAPPARAESIAALRERIQGGRCKCLGFQRCRKKKEARARNSAAIEGSSLTLEDVRALEEGATVPAPEPAREKR